MSQVYVGKDVQITLQVPVEEEDETLKLCTLVENEAVVRGDTPDTSDALANSNVQYIVRVGDSSGAYNYALGADYQIGSDRASIDWSPSGNEPAAGATYYVTYYYMSGTEFTVDHTPISDRDLDGVADEVEHVTVKINGVEVTPASVDDESGTVTLSSMPEAGSTVTCSYRYDSDPYIAQEISLEPKQRIEGIDALGSDTIQEWAVLMKEIDGNIKEAFQTGNLEQLRRVKPFKTNVYDTFPEEYTIQVYNGWRCKGQTWDNSKRSWHDGVMKLGAGDEQVCYFRDGVGDMTDYELTFRMKPVTFDSQSRALGCVLRAPKPESWGWAYVKGIVLLLSPTGQLRLGLNLYSANGAVPDTILGYYGGVTLDEWHTYKIRVQGSNIKVWLDGTLIFNVTDSTYTRGSPALLASGYGIGHHAYADFDDVRIVELNSTEHAVEVAWDKAGSTVKVGLDGAVFPEGSIPVPKNEPVYIVSPFKARSIKVIT